MLIGTFSSLLSHAAALPRQRVVLINPSNAATFEAIAEARRALGVEFTVTGEASTLREGLARSGVPDDGVDVVHASGHARALEAAIEAVGQGGGDILMKGGVDTSTMMKAVLRETSGLRTDRLLSDVFVLEYPERRENAFIMITDGGINPAPDLRAKVELIRNAVEVAHALGNATPKVAILSATEFVSPGLPSTIDAAVLSKMNERGQITGCVVDGPLALDNALFPEAAEEKGIRSAVAGRAEILVAPTIEAANALAKSTTYFARLPLAHVVLGAAVPILIPSRADGSAARLASMALGMLMRQHGRRGGQP